MGLTLCGTVAEGDVAPDIAGEIQQHRVGAGHGVEELAHVVVRFDLRRVGVLLEAQAGDEDGTKGGPVDVRVGRQVGVVVADGPVHLPEQLHARDPVALALQAQQHIGEFLAKGGG
jgi:hypothetical protein